MANSEKVGFMKLFLMLVAIVGGSYLLIFVFLYPGLSINPALDFESRVQMEEKIND